MNRLEICCMCEHLIGTTVAGDGGIYWLDGHLGPLCDICNRTLREDVLADCGLADPADLRAQRDGLLASCRGFLADPIVAALDLSCTPMDPDEARGFDLLRAIQAAVAACEPTAHEGN